MPAPLSPAELEARLSAVRHAAMELFATHGYAATSMGAIADASGLSRPALYQHFENREAIFRSALAEILLEANNAALAALARPVDLTDRFDGYLQRCRGDVIGALLGSPHGDELLEARGTAASDVANAAHRERRFALDAVLQEVTGGDLEMSKRVAELLELGPLGLKHDAPTPATYRKRLRSLAEAASALVG